MPKEIFAAESEKFKPPPPMVTWLRKQIEELPWQRVTRQKVTQSFTHVKEITFPPLTANKETGGPLVIEAKISGHAIHRIYVDGGSSMEKKQGQAPERAKAIHVEVQKLVEAGILREVYYHDWLSNPVMVKKHDGNVCGLHRLNKACPQDCYPISEIDWNVESLCGYPFKCFMDAYKGYHQIQMVEQDEKKTAFHTTHGCSFDDQKGHSPDTGLFCESSVAGSRAKLYPNGKASHGTSLRRQEVAQILPGEHNITYRSWTSVKGQILADFLVEKPDNALPKASVIETPQEPWTLFNNGSSCVDGSGTGLILTSPEGMEFTYALRFQFITSNNEAEYEALIAGLRIVPQMRVHNIHVSVDSKLVANQVLGTYVAKEENMVKCLEKTKSLISGFANFSISQVPRSKNKKADALSKIASTSFAHLSKQVLVEVLKEKSIQEEVATVVEEEGQTWMTPIMQYLKDGTFPGDRKEARKLRIKDRQYELLEGVLYRRSFLVLDHSKRIIMPTYCTAVVDAIHNNEELRLNLDLLEEQRECATIPEAKEKLKMIKYYNTRVHGVTFRPGDFVYRSNEANHAMEGESLVRSGKDPTRSPKHSEMKLTS
nr:reverse transcriptase domain-containing protein [Tanacetum cinerariifolium]